MAILHKKEVYSEYQVRINEIEMVLLIKGLELMDKTDKENPEKSDMTKTYCLLKELKGMRDKRIN